jgi:DnaJ-domain-containing protein 1
MQEEEQDEISDKSHSSIYVLSFHLIILFHLPPLHDLELSCQSLAEYSLLPTARWWTLDLPGVTMPLLTEEESALDPYRILDLALGATDQEIKKAYRKASLRWHPDKNSSEEARTSPTIL